MTMVFLPFLEVEIFATQINKGNTMVTTPTANFSSLTDIKHIEYDVKNGSLKEVYANSSMEMAIVKDNTIYLDDVYSIPIAVIRDKTIIINGDYNEETNTSILSFHTTDSPTISFNCLSRFLTKKGSPNPKLIAKYIVNGKVEIIDYTLDSKNNTSKNKSPGLSYTWIGNGSIGYWHTPGYVLVSFDNRTVILGQEEGSYFGSEIKYDAKIKTVTQALKALTPKRLLRRKDYQRQGEWFIVPVKENQVPCVSKCIASSDYYLYLPVKTKYSKRHTIESTDIRIDSKGNIYAYLMTLSHDDHDYITYKNWATFIENNAIVSYSEEGVD